MMATTPGRRLRHRLWTWRSTQRTRCSVCLTTARTTANWTSAAWTLRTAAALSLRSCRLTFRSSSSKRPPSSKTCVAALCRSTTASSSAFWPRGQQERCWFKAPFPFGFFHKLPQKHLGFEKIAAAVVAYQNFYQDTVSPKDLWEQTSFLHAQAP